MLKLIVDKLARITKNREKLEKQLCVKITNRGKEVFIEGLAENEYIAEKIITALNFGFPYSDALLLIEDEFMLEIINIKDHTRKRDLARIRARIIGKDGKTLKTLAELTKCNFEIKGHSVGIIGPLEFIKNAQDGIISLIKGTRQGNVYAYLEKHQPKPIIDLGLKDEREGSNFL